MKKILCLILAAVMICCLWGCSGSSAKLTGRWEAINYYNSEDILAEFESFDFYEEEIALLDPGAMEVCDVLILNDDMTYTITCNAAKSYEMVDAYYRNVFSTFYDNREQLQQVYGVDFAAMTEAEFYQFYADMYGAADYEALIALFVGVPADYAYLEEEPEKGTYRISLNKIYFTIENTTAEEFVTFALDENQLKIDYTDYSLTYTLAE